MAVLILLYGLECWTTRKKDIKRVKTAKMKSVRPF